MVEDCNRSGFRVGEKKDWFENEMDEWFAVKLQSASNRKWRGDVSNEV